MKHTLTETLTTPIEPAGDVLVAGSGSAGFAAAIAAARTGATVTLIESAGYLGGNMASGLPIIGCHDGKKQVVKGIFDELIQRLTEYGGAEGDPAETTVQNIDPEKIKIIITRMLAEAGVQVRLHTMLVGVQTDGTRITHAIVEQKGGREALTAAYFVDTSGDGDLAAFAGVPFEIGRKEDGKTQACTLMFAVGGIDTQRFAQWGDGSEETAFKKLVEVYQQVSSANNFQNPRRTSLSDLWGVRSRTGERTFNATRVMDILGSDSRGLSTAGINVREQLWEFLEIFLKPNVPGFEQSYIAWSAAKIGVRETRRIMGEYLLNKTDILEFKKFPDTICCGSYPIDVHLPATGGKETTFTPDHFYGGRYWTIPYRSLVPQKIDNLWVAGRCLSATHLALSAVRCMANTLGMGQAAGTAAALCAQSGETNRELPPKTLQDQLLEQGAWLGENPT